MVQKIRPRTEIEYDYGNDGRDGHNYIAYYCPTCNRKIKDYQADIACDKCGTFYDWGNKKPHIKIIYKVIWE